MGRLHLLIVIAVGGLPSCFAPSPPTTCDTTFCSTGGHTFGIFEAVGIPTMYIQCVWGNSVCMSCPPSTEFNPSIMTCDHVQPSSPCDATFCSTGGHTFGIFEAVGIPSMYIQCVWGNTFCKPCAPGTTFNPAIMSCDHVQTSQCCGTCIGVPDGDYENVGSCSKSFYISCSNQHAICRNCPQGLQFITNSGASGGGPVQGPGGYTGSCM